MFEIKKIWYLILIVGQFGTGQFGTKIIKGTIWHQDNKSEQFGTKIIKVDNLALGQFSTRTIWHQDNLAPDNLAPGQKKSKKCFFFAISAKIRYHIFPEMLLYLKSLTCFSPPPSPPK